jgi:hypothetical protein
MVLDANTSHFVLPVFVCFLQPPLLIEVEIIGNVFIVTVNTDGSNNSAMASWGRTFSQLAFYPLLTATLTFIRKWFELKMPFLIAQDWDLEKSRSKVETL